MFIKKRIIATALASLSIVTTTAGTLKNNSYAASTSIPYTTKKSEGSKFKEFIKSNPELSILGAKIAIIATLAIVGKIAEKISFRNITTAVDKMTDEQVIKYRDEQIEEFKKIGSGCYEVSNDFINNLSPRITALIMAEINSIFKAFPNIINAHLRSARHDGVKFWIETIKEKSNTVARANIHHIQFNKHHYKSLSKRLHSEKAQVNQGFHCLVDNSKLVEYTPAHEIGHVLEYIITSILPLNNFTKYIIKANEKHCEPETIIKEEIIQIAKNKFNYRGDIEISDYGKTNDKEWFAELCAYYFCNEKPNALGLAFKEFLDQKEREYAYMPGVAA